METNILRSEEQAASIKRDVLHYMLQAALVEIRASDTIHAARKFADVFHNLPMRLLRCTTNEDYDSALAALVTRAAKWDLDEYVQELWVVAVKSVSEKMENTMYKPSQQKGGGGS